MRRALILENQNFFESNCQICNLQIKVLRNSNTQFKFQSTNLILRDPSFTFLIRGMRHLHFFKKEKSLLFCRFVCYNLAIIFHGINFQCIALFPEFTKYLSFDCINWIQNTEENTKLVIFLKNPNSWFLQYLFYVMHLYI